MLFFSGVHASPDVLEQLHVLSKRHPRRMVFMVRASSEKLDRVELAVEGYDNFADRVISFDYEKYALERLFENRGSNQEEREYEQHMHRMRNQPEFREIIRQRSVRLDERGNP